MAVACDAARLLPVAMLLRSGASTSPVRAAAPLAMRILLRIAVSRALLLCSSQRPGSSAQCTLPA